MVINKYNNWCIKILFEEFVVLCIVYRFKFLCSCNNLEKIRMFYINLKNGRCSVENFEFNFDGGIIDVEVLDKIVVIF